MNEDERKQYDEWFQRARPLLEQARWSEAMKDVPRLALEPSRPRPLAKPLFEATVALVTSAGLSAPGQPRMDGPNIEGDYTIRIIDADEPTGGLLISHTHFDTATAEQDINVVYPIDRLKELAAEGIIGGVAPRTVSFMGYFSNVYRMRDEVSPAVVAAVKEVEADAAVLVPV